MQLSLDDLIRINEAVFKSTQTADEAPPLDQLALKHIANLLEHSAGSFVDDPIGVAAHLAAYVSWARPFGHTSDRTALVTAAVVIDLAKAKMPGDWSGFATLLLEFRAGGVGPSGRTQALKSWLSNSTTPAHL